MGDVRIMLEFVSIYATLSGCSREGFSLISQGVAIFSFLTQGVAIGLGFSSHPKVLRFFHCYHKALPLG